MICNSMSMHMEEMFTYHLKMFADIHESVHSAEQEQSFKPYYNKHTNVYIPFKDVC